MTARAIAGIVLAAGAVSWAQQISGEPEVRRAIPVGSPAADPPPSGSADPAAATPPAVPGEPFRPQRPPAAPTPAPDEEGTIRIAPAAQPNRSEALETANSLYARKMYDLAIPEYERFLISSGGVGGRDAAMFRLAECHRILGNPAAARAGYEKLVMEFRGGEFAGAGAYRLGEILFSETIYDAAHTQFETAVREAKDPQVRLTARYFSARSLDNMKNDGARAAYEAVLAEKGKNPYRDHAMMALANLDARAGDKERAFAAYEELAAGPRGPGATEAAVKAAALASDLGKPDKAAALFGKVLADPESGDWRALAVVGTMRLRYQASDYRGVVALAGEVDALPDASREDALRMLASSHRKTANNLDARRTYDRLLKEFPGSESGGEARLQRLASLCALKDKNILAEIDAFLEKTTDPNERTRALQLKAEVVFKSGDHAAAAKIFEALLARELPNDVRADTLYRFAWSLAAAGESPAAASAYSEFLLKYPDHKLAPTALAQRALAREQSKALDSAIGDFDAIAEKYPGTKEHEIALLHKALVLGQRQQFPEMAAAFGKLLEVFPKTAAAAQANFWLGWAAFEQKDFQTAITRLEAARSLDGQYAERSTMRIILAHYYLEDREAVAREAAAYKGGNLPAEVSLWLASKYVDDADYAKAETILLPLSANPAALPPDAWIQLAECQIRLGKFRDARASADKFLASARDPATRARGLLAVARTGLGLKKFDEAKQAADEALMLQPEGRLNAEGRLLLGDILLAQSDPDGAARAYMTVSVLLDDPSITPLALRKASDAYRRANNRFESDKALDELRRRYPDFEKSTNPKKSKP
jgi:TolA-binding protein